MSHRLVRTINDNVAIWQGNLGQHNQYFYARKISSNTEIAVLKQAIRTVQDIFKKNLFTHETSLQVTESISGIIHFLRDGDGIFPQFDALFYPNESIAVNMNLNKAAFIAQMKKDYHFLNLLKRLLISIDYLHDLCGIAHNAINLEHIFLDDHFNPKLGGFGAANVDITEEQMVQDLNNLGRHLLVLHKFVRENSEEIINNRLFSQEKFLEIADGVFQHLATATVENIQGRLQFIRGNVIEHIFNIQNEYQDALRKMGLDDD